MKRSLEEQTELYKDNPAAAPKHSPHLVWEAADVRSSDFSDKELQKMVAFLNLFTYAGGQRPVGIYHNIGNGIHLHIQFTGAKNNV